MLSMCLEDIVEKAVEISYGNLNHLKHAIYADPVVIQKTVALFLHALETTEVGELVITSDATLVSLAVLSILEERLELSIVKKVRPIVRPSVRRKNENNTSLVDCIDN